MNEHDTPIPTTPSEAATWLIKAANDVLTDSEGNVVAADRFFAAAYQMMKHGMTEQEQALFTLLLHNDLNASRPTWWTGKTSSPLNSEVNADESSQGGI